MKKIYLCSDDINLVTHWNDAISDETLIVDVLEDMMTLTSSYIILNVMTCQNKCKEVLTHLVENNNTIFLLDRAPTLEKAKYYLRFSIKGYGNALMHKNLFDNALEIIRGGMIWLHPDLLSELIFALPSNPKQDIEAKLEPLSPREKTVALMLRDGLTYKEMGLTLEITSRTIKAHAQSIYTKLHVKDRLALALYLTA
ncbi:MAG: LuxR C-terminal-related transcriptional regulator [Sulfurimonadaceae bacterium]|jgi:DNA-binding NarL/FixJ family response regulator|nr:LuxR C-terminal-related transcriptional regulator [Sulfurimonadaceae bacterium]